MSVERVHSTAHEVTIGAPAGVVYALLTDSPHWPLHLGAAVHVEQLEFDGRRERTRVWSTAGGRVDSWTSLRTLTPELLQVEFRQEQPTAPGQPLSGIWSVVALTAQRSRLTLRYNFTTSAGDPAAVLTSLRRTAELWPRLDELALSFDDSVRIEGPAEPVYDFLYRVQDWPGRVPGVIRADVVEDGPGVQAVTMDTREPDGSVQTTRSLRLCFPHAQLIVHKQLTASGLLGAHTGEWSLVPDERGVTLSAHQDVVLCPESIGRVLGEGAGTAMARHQVRQRIEGAGARVLDLAKKHAESAVRML
ncbi:aromatase/cyclase [Streptomyces sp. NPDC057302]|uniref:aromatase/cyclase n=1 Tax=Streptomyces sp. NPDC057302 TaxID=3346094 RepID=UPI00362F1F27